MLVSSDQLLVRLLGSCPVLHSFKQIRDADAQSIREHLDGIDRRVGTTSFNAGHIRPCEAALVSERFLTHVHGDTQLPYTGAELVLKRWGG